ncbi:Auxin Efflux Carrier [Pyrolobus fumarii 1A]|uniref:Auxin Efflux Carrier n=1 Tax=Pyrolobus fumarii (strain DSM 11204 / 1A) TaxID=694429 RepID=G0ED58_PYRF1|nr:Auxin Efflux Carrier [Pyrolobus fumarii]AEM39736.1 Auxin Efflux Carrier [Pyrolobus fumarii 1A]
MGPLLNAVLFAILVTLGYVSRRTRLERLLVEPSVKLLLYIIVPLSIARAYALHGIEAFTSYSLIALVAFAASTPYAMIASRRLCGWNAKCKTVVMLTLLFPNSVFLPLSLAPPLGLDIDVISSYALPLILLHFTLGYRLGGEKSRRDVPLLVVTAAATGLALSISSLTPLLEPLWHAAGLLGRLSGYASMLVVGASLPELRATHLRDPLLYFIALWRGVASPILHYSLAMVAGVTGAALKTLMVEAVMAPATMNAVIARHLGVDHERVATTILVLTPLAALEALLLTLLLNP